MTNIVFFNTHRLLQKWNRRWFVLHGTTRAGVVRIEYYDNEGCEITGEGKRTIPLRDCSSLSEMVGSKVHPYVFQFKTPLGKCTLSGVHVLK